MSEDAKRQATFQYLNETVPNMPVGFGDNLSEVVFDALPHSQAQQVIMASMNLVPDLDRAAFTKVTTVADIVAWLGPATSVWAENRGRIVNRPRGSYVTAAATLRPLVDGDLDLAYMASLNPQNSHRWRYRGQTPSPEDFRRSVFAPGILAQFAVVSRDDRLGAAAGMVVA